MYVELDARKFFVPPVGSNGLAEALPSLVYWDRGVLEHELETVFRRSWLCVPKQLFVEHNPNVRSIYVRPAPGHPHFDVAALRGNALRFRLLGESVMLRRGSEPKGSPELRCFLNKCPHAGYPLLEVTHDADNEAPIVCQQHGLTADERGKLIAHPAFLNPTEEQRKKLCLTRYGLAEWFDFLFISRGEPAMPFEEVMRPVLDSIINLPLAEFKYRKLNVEQRFVEGNWKLHAQNYEDWLHIRYIHKKPNGLADAVDLSSARMELYDQATLMWAYAADPADGFDSKDLPERFSDPENPNKRVFALWWFVAPNLALNFYPWGLSVNIFMPAMVDVEKMEFDPEKVEFLWYHYVWNESKYGDRDKRWLNTLVDLEDIETIRYLAENYRSHSLPWSRGLFGTASEGPNTEIGPWWFHRLVYQMMFESGVP